MNRYILFFLIITLSACQGERPVKVLGAKEQNILGTAKMALSPCPDKPNCITSYKRKEDDSHYMDPIKIVSNKERAHEKILGILKKMPSAQIIEQKEDYIYAEFTSSIMKFVDDVEFYFEGSDVVHFRSASRVGRSDFGINKKRMGDITFKFHQNDF